MIAAHGSAYDGTDNAWARVEMFDEYHRNITGADVADHTAAHAGDHTEKYLEEQIIERGTGGYPDHGKCGQTDGIREDPYELIEIDPLADERQKDDDGNADGKQRVDRIPESGRRRHADDEITNDPATDSRNDTERRYTEDVHLLTYADDRARNRKSDRSDDLKNEFEHDCLF